jgi:hypothetical protein
LSNILYIVPTFIKVRKAIRIYLGFENGPPAPKNMSLKVTPWFGTSDSIAFLGEKPSGSG